MKLTDNNPEQYITTQKSTMMLLVDPNKESNLRVLEMISGRLYSGPTYSKFFEQSSYELGYTIHDSKIYDGKSCTDYKRMNSSYGNCVDSIMKRHLMECYGCLPPWFPAQKGMICESDKTVVTSDHAKCKGLKRLFAIFYWEET